MNIYIDAIEAVELANPAQTDIRNFSRQISRIFAAKPLEADEENFYRFLDTVFNAGRISGVRQERIRRKHAAGRV